MITSTTLLIGMQEDRRVIIESIWWRWNKQTWWKISHVLFARSKSSLMGHMRQCSYMSLQWVVIDDSCERGSRCTTLPWLCVTEKNCFALYYIVSLVVHAFSFATLSAALSAALLMMMTIMVKMMLMAMMMICTIAVGMKKNVLALLRFSCCFRFVMYNSFLNSHPYAPDKKRV